jgi:hypothetical protein
MQQMMSSMGSMDPGMMQQQMRMMQNMSPADMERMSQQVGSMDPTTLASQAEQAQKMLSSQQKYILEVCLLPAGCSAGMGSCDVPAAQLQQQCNSTVTDMSDYLSVRSRWDMPAALPVVLNVTMCMQLQGSKMLKTDGNKLVADGESTQFPCIKQRHTVSMHPAAAHSFHASSSGTQFPCIKQQHTVVMH